MTVRNGPSGTGHRAQPRVTTVFGRASGRAALPGEPAPARISNTWSKRPETPILVSPVATVTAQPDDRPSEATGDPLAPFSPAVRAWFESSFAAPTQAQAEGWAAISSGRHTLIHAPTGSGKTLAAFLWTLDRLATSPPRPASTKSQPGTVRVLYVSPLKALTYDVERNLRAPLAGIGLAAARLGLPVPEISVASRTGDTPAEDRRNLARRPPDILITTPESLYLMLTSAAREVGPRVRRS